MWLHIAAWIIINWLLAAAWISNPVYALWAALVVFLWWTAWYYRFPPWPHPAWRFLVYLFFIGSAFIFAFFSGFWQVYFVMFEIMAFWLGEILIQRRKRKV